MKIGTLDRTCVNWHMLFHMIEVTSWALEWSKSNIRFPSDYFRKCSLNIRMLLISKLLLLGLLYSYINNNIWHLHSLLIDESHGYV